MLKSITSFLAIVVGLAAAMGGGYFLLNMANRADLAHEQAMKPVAASLPADQSLTPTSGPHRAYPWVTQYDSASTLAARIPAPRGYERAEVDPDGFAHWLRNLPLKPAGTPVRLFNGQARPDQSGHVAVLDVDVGSKDLQQCADAIIRLRAEYLYNKQQFSRIHFNFTSGVTVEFSKWAQGIKPELQGNTLTWTKARRNATKDYSYDNFRTYLDTIFAYAGTASLSQELVQVNPVKLMNIGNVFIQGGNPGHAVLVIDMVENKRNGAKAFLLAQSFMPAQDIHILRNTRPADTGIWPWYDVNFGPQLTTPDWKFNRTDLKRFK
jgi:hypothetical protein